MNYVLLAIMNHAARRGVVILLVILLTATRALRAQPYVTVIDNGVDFNPDPVNIVTGMAVYWVDDGSGPYNIYSTTTAWSPFATPGGILFSVAGTYPYFDDAGDQGTVYVTPNLPPTVAITNPTNNAVFTAPASFTFSANAADTDADGMSDVQFFVGTNEVDDVFSSPYETAVTNLTVGTYTLTAAAYDNVGAVTTNAITIVVQNPAPITLMALAAAAGRFEFTASGLTVGKTNLLQGSTNPISSADWVSISTNVASGSLVSFTNAISGGHGFFRLVQLP
jgi:hypothetical protein